MSNPGSPADGGMNAQLAIIRAIFEQALEIPTGALREKYLDDACAGQIHLRDRVDGLLRADANAGSFLGKPALDERATSPLELVYERVGSVIGPYKLLEQIGEGGFGAVFMAEQERPLRRRVALKVIKPGMDSRQVIARFEAERQALALMEHPNISRVLDAGATASGRPYFVMELVRGVPITEFCDQNRFAVDDRMRLFATVCGAVQHAHQRGIIHRDIKPNNVLVTLHDGLPVAKVIDFGVAKATGQRLTDKTLFTAFAQMVGTPLYMSPEQAEMSGIDVDTRSDIYSLGVLLYELLTGTTPFDKKRMREVGYDEFRRIVREEEPPKPSARISTLGLAATLVCDQRKIDPRKLGQRIRGELDWIVMKCLDKDRNRRYETASGLGRDIERYLRNEPVEACPPSGFYRLRKFVRRNRVRLSMFTSALALVAVVAVSSWWITSLRRENHELQGNVSVNVATKPSGARIALVPINSRTGELDPNPESVIRPNGSTPLRTQVKPGRYLLEALVPGNREAPLFAETEITIPSESPPAERALSATQKGKLDEHYSIDVTIPNQQEIERMVLVPVNEEIRRKNPLLPEYLYVDEKETPLKSIPGTLFEGALTRAYLRGLRLASAEEYDAIVDAARKKRIRKVDSVEPVSMPDLFGGLAEYTVTKYAFPISNRVTFDAAEKLRRMQVLKGYGNPTSLPGLLFMPGVLLAPPDSDSPDLGFRCVRSVKPRFLNP